ncbi:hypothetical protein PsorP6_016055 [Peronosclerospora sorghi]|uniref:Uncharacterized protein n=1 Tax=Peronosclerospora sorghi TaxID=230839 RepID=A0ACC0WMY8_9STRA|nr:hypothetical protein PsorP6_016055 [Peronosclerospora sorghi]
MSERDFTLNNAVFAFHCLSSAKRQEMKALVLRNNGRLYDAASVGITGVVYVITSYWADYEPTATIASVSMEPVTCFWLKEMIRLSRWIQPDDHPFFRLPPRPSDLWLQYPMDYHDTGEDEGSTDHRMRLPCSPSFLYRGEVPLWPYIAAYLAKPIRNLHELVVRLQQVTLSGQRRSFNCLEYAVNELLTREEQILFFKDVLPEMVQLVLSLPKIFPIPPPLLTPSEAFGNVNANDSANEDKTPESGACSSKRARVVTRSHRFSKLEVLTLVCGCFFCIFPDQSITQAERNSHLKEKKLSGSCSVEHVIEFPHFTAVRMFSAPGQMSKLIALKGQKIRCLLQYFLRLVPRVTFKHGSILTEVIDFTRVGVQLPFSPEQMCTEELVRTLGPSGQSERSSTQAQRDAEVHLRLRYARCVSNTLIEDLDKHLQIDFANKFAGGGVLGSGCVQEEIRFLLSPELLVSCLIFAKLEPHEAFVVHGTERCSAYIGYGGSFEYGGNFEDTTSLCSVFGGLLRRECVVVGIDATDYRSVQEEQQYTRKHVWHDLLKAYAGFSYPEASQEKCRWPVATGNWGCGVFRGDRELKFLIQWLAASLCRRELVYVSVQNDVDFELKVNPLLAMATSLKARAWDQQTGGVLQWLVGFLFNELSSQCGIQGEPSVLMRASSSLKIALVSLQRSGSHTESNGDDRLSEESCNLQMEKKVEIPVSFNQDGEHNKACRNDENRIKKKTKMMERRIEEFFGKQ